MFAPRSPPLELGVHEVEAPLDDAAQIGQHVGCDLALVAPSSDVGHRQRLEPLDVLRTQQGVDAFNGHI